MAGAAAGERLARGRVNGMVSKVSPEQRKEPDAPREPGRRRLSVLLGFARAALLWERVWPAVWPMVGIAGVFLAAALLDLLPYLPGWPHALLLAGFAAALGYATLRAVTGLGLPTAEQAGRRLEKDSGLTHRPLTTLDDALAAGADDQDSAALWELHRQRLRGQLRALRVALPRAGLAVVDPLALRAALGLVLVIALITGQGEWGTRLKRAVMPELSVFAAAPPTRLDVWITPPAYTALPPLFLDPAAPGEEPLGVPTGSAVLAQIEGGRGVPSLVIGDETTPFAVVTADAYKVEAEIKEGERLAIEQDSRELAAWTLALQPDAGPSIEFISPPARTERAALSLEYEATDDYGLAAVGTIIRRLDDPNIEPMEIDLLLPGMGLRKAEEASYHDLTPHPWAGLAVDITLVAQDAIGQLGMSDPVRTVLPERIFNHPVARALVELRKQLTLNPDGRLPVVRSLAEIYAWPDHFFNDIVVALAILSAERRLIHDPTREAVTEVQQILWDTALHIEEGELAIAERDLREIQKQLMEALARGAEDEEVERMLDQLQQALDRFLEALAEQLREQLAEGAEIEAPPPDAQILQGEDLQDLIDRARELARTGSRDAARDLLAQLQKMLENLRANPYGQGMDEGMRNAMRMRQDMESLMDRQQELLNRSFQRSQRGGPNSGDPRAAERGNRSDALGQDRLRRELGEIMRHLGEALGDIPRSLGRAEQSMRDARDALEGNRSGDAVGPQSRALDQLQQGLQAMADQFMEQMGQGQGNMGQLGAQPGRGRDPLGRRPGSVGFEALEGVKIPDQMELRRAREILDELRRRRSERQRPALELDYIDRLLRQF